MHPDVSSITTTDIPLVNVAAHGTLFTVIHSGCDLYLTGMVDGVGG